MAAPLCTHVIYEMLCFCAGSVDSRRRHSSIGTGRGLAQLDISVAPMPAGRGPQPSTR